MNNLKMNYTLPTQNDHRGLLEKIQSLKGQILISRDSIKGPDGKGFLPDETTVIQLKNYWNLEIINS